VVAIGTQLRVTKSFPAEAQELVADTISTPAEIWLSSQGEDSSECIYCEAIGVITSIGGVSDLKEPGGIFYEFFNAHEEEVRNVQEL
jgi:hypothetical protein